MPCEFGSSKIKGCSMIAYIYNTLGVSLSAEGGVSLSAEGVSLSAEGCIPFGRHITLLITPLIRFLSETKHPNQISLQSILVHPSLRAKGIALRAGKADSLERQNSQSHCRFAALHGNSQKQHLGHTHRDWFNQKYRTPCLSRRCASRLAGILINPL